MFEGRNSEDDDLMRDGQISGRIDGDGDTERCWLRGLEEQRCCSVAPGHDTLQTHTCAQSELQPHKGNKTSHEVQRQSSRSTTIQHSMQCDV